MLSDDLLAQNRISGRVVDADTGEGLPSANVFFGCTRIGVSADKNGWFTLEGFPDGKYDFTVSYVGYLMHSQSYNFTGSEQLRLQIKMKPDVRQLSTVVIRPDDSDRFENLILFKRLFLGETKAAKQCKILNTDDLILYRDKGELIARCYKPLIIENRHLGYRISYHMSLFQYQFSIGRLDVYGVLQFAEMVAKNEKQQQEWEANRAEAYSGSIIHFMRAIAGNKLIEEHFDAQRIIKVRNPYWLPPEARKRTVDSLQALLAKPGASDPVAIWRKMQGYQYEGFEKTKDSLLIAIIHGHELLNPDTLLQVMFIGELRVTYGQKIEEIEVMEKGKKVPKVRADLGVYSRMHIFAKFNVYANGYYDNPENLLLDGHWGNTEKLPIMLPLDYELKGGQKSN